MPITTQPEWQTLALYAGGAALFLMLLFNLPYIGRFVRFLFSFAMLAVALYLLAAQAPFDPTLGRIWSRLGLDEQRVVGTDVRIPMAPDGHFWARVTINGIERRLLVDSGATITALSAETAAQTGVDAREGLMPIMLRTANGTVQAQTGTIDRLRLGDIEATDLKVVISPALGNVDVLGMNFLSQLASWRVEGRTLVLVPNAI
ncbi:MAG: retropepsin-like aspartic protease [Pseudomonadota bacterium]